MKRLRIVVPLALVLALAVVGLVFAQAYNTGFITSVTYQNVGDGDATVVFSFHNEKTGTSIDVERNLPKDAGSSLYVGGLSGDEELPSGFMGSAVVSSDQPIVATLVQIPQSDTVKNRPLSNGFDSGAPEVLVATVLKNKFNTTSKFSVQNADDVAVDVTVDFYDADNPSDPPITVTEDNIPAGAAKYFDAGQISDLPSTFNGSAIVSAVETGTSTDANIVASALELSTSGTAASSFEGLTGSSSTVYMATALCQAFGATSYYAVQNTEPSGGPNADVTVNYSNGNTDTATISPGAKASFSGCDVNSANFSGAATIDSLGGEIVVIGKVSGSGISSAFLGEESGSDTLALPYVRWTSDANYSAGTRQRAFIAIQNVSGSDIAANQVDVKYLNKNGEVVGTHTLGAIADGAKANSTAVNATLASGHTQSELTEFGTPDANPGGGYGGSVLIEGPTGSELIAVVRIASDVGSGLVGEDYNGIALP